MLTVLVPTVLVLFVFYSACTLALIAFVAGVLAVGLMLIERIARCLGIHKEIVRWLMMVAREQKPLSLSEANRFLREENKSLTSKTCALGSELDDIRNPESYEQCKVVDGVWKPCSKDSAIVMKPCSKEQAEGWHYGFGVRRIYYCPFCGQRLPPTAPVQSTVGEQKEEGPQKG